jgi:hypothetical protein
MSVVLKYWLVSSTREYVEGKSCLTGNVFYYTFFNGFTNVTYEIKALADLTDFPAEPNLTLWEVLDPRTYSITDSEQTTLITMPGDIIMIDGREKINTSWGKVVCIELEYDVTPVISYAITDVVMLRADTQIVNLRVPAFYQDSIRYDKIFCDNLNWTFKYLPINFLNAPDAFNIIVHITFDDDFNYAVNELFDLFFTWQINFAAANISILCKDGNTYLNGLTQRYALTQTDVLTFNVVKTSQSANITITEL